MVSTLTYIGLRTCRYRPRTTNARDGSSGASVPRSTAAKWRTAKRTSCKICIMRLIGRMVSIIEITFASLIFWRYQDLRNLPRFGRGKGLNPRHSPENCSVAARDAGFGRLLLDKLKRLQRPNKPIQLAEVAKFRREILKPIRREGVLIRTP